MEFLDKSRACEMLRGFGFKSLLLLPRWMARLFGVLIYNNILYLKAFSTFVYELCGYNTEKAGINLERFGAILSQ